MVLRFGKVIISPTNEGRYCSWVVWKETAPVGEVAHSEMRYHTGQYFATVGEKIIPVHASILSQQCFTIPWTTLKLISISLEDKAILITLSICKDYI